jgi:hypothetical protein
VAAFHFLPARTRLWLVKRVLGPFGSWWLKPRLDGAVSAHLGRHLTDGRQDGGAGPGSRRLGRRKPWRPGAE